MLSKKEYWDGNYETTKPNITKFKSYSNQYLINLCKKHVPKNNGKFIEVGCAPGNNIVDFYNAFGFMGYGVDYSMNGFVQTMKVLADNGMNPFHVFNYDFTSSKFQDKFKEEFDVVASFGFLEHFENPDDIINMHLNILKLGGYLIIVIPNLLGINRILSDFFNPDVIKMCNTDIMDKSIFESLFADKGLMKLHCEYYGLFNLGLFNTPRTSFKLPLMKVCYGLQFGMDRIVERLFMNRNIECSAVSPYIVYIGRKL